MMTTKEILIKAKVLIEKGWTQGVAARNDYGFIVHPTDPKACEWCATGAIRAVAMGDSETREIAIYLEDFIELKSTLVSFNDNVNTTREDILELFDRVIKVC